MLCCLFLQMTYPFPTATRDQKTKTMVCSRVRKPECGKHTDCVWKVGHGCNGKPPRGASLCLPSMNRKQCREAPGAGCHYNFRHGCYPPGGPKPPRKQWWCNGDAKRCEAVYKHGGKFHTRPTLGGAGFGVMMHE